MNIVYITTEFVTEELGYGGLSTYLYKITSTLASKGHKVTVIVQSNKNESFSFENMQVERVKVNLLNPFYKIIKKLLRRELDLDWLYASYLLNKRVKKLSKAKAIDIIQYSSLYAPGFFRPSNIPCVTRLTTSRIKYNTEFNTGIRKNEHELRKDWIEIASIKKSDGIYGPSNFIAKAVEEVTGRKIRVIETPFVIPELENFNLPQELGFLKDKKYLLFFGRINKVKGAHLIAEIIYDVMSKYRDLYFVFAGRDLGYKDIIQNNAAEYAKRVIFLGNMDKENLFPIIEHSYGVVLPSIVDNLPNSCIEAMSMSKVVIGTDGVSFEQLIKDSKNGFLMKLGDSKSLLDKINQFLSLNNTEKARLEANAKKRIGLLEPSIVAKTVLEFYNSVIKDFNTKT